MSQKLAVVTLGCEKNLVDSEVMMGLVSKKGYQVVQNPEEADVIIVNTCGFIDAAKAESVETILSMAQYKEDGSCKALLVAGCMAQRYQDELIAEIPEIDGIVGTGEYHRIDELINISLIGEEKPQFVGNPVYLYDELTPRFMTGGSSAYVKIAEGCDHSCTFCIIPKMRGKFRSRPIESIVAEAKSLAAQGVKEIMLIAQDSTQYGLDVYGKRNLHGLLEALNEVEGLEWIRLHYAYPGFFTDEVIDAFARLPKVAKYIDMPLQHSEDSILKAMRRPGHQAQIRKLVAKIRDRVPEVALRTSFIVGFPGETEQDFENLCRFVREIGFDRIGVFTYSPEEGTPSAEMDRQVPEDVKERRASILMEVGREVAAERNAERVGSVLKVLIERPDDDNPGVYVGRTEYDAKEIDGQVFVTSNREIRTGDMVNVRITHSYDFDLAGECI
ncbi:30S ribosomal protein S12 methylthiotransferase RimO [Effusibacillus lacus]|uniref:Ribosomal protein uS12 methylthiotransferase RimO n=1 Tax=Effusibacillus lacus TaxID=1348429 RepID=A0A292YTJ7_9BACL|nr:30S ribosomal protein S12 methylthiotransferase RimO [Effusibacillus lacus]TCS76257.1 ribosomal protein S12 methylthiotransferase [Effusibacillus lacus]GAX91805.1 ribosomal protein S12 methylthiotransferase RimO [Effusibacillus lacus]